MDTKFNETKVLSPEEVVHEARKAAGCRPDESLIERCAMLEEYWDRMHRRDGDDCAVEGPRQYTAGTVLEIPPYATIILHPSAFTPSP
jgi:hypothetical protein